MRKCFFLALFFVVANLSNAQIIKDSIPVKHWKIHGINSLTGAQTSFDNWQVGGSNNLTVNIKANYDINYKLDSWSWDNKIIANYGFNRQKRNTIKKTDDSIEINSILAKKYKQNWNFSFYMNFQTQFDKGYNPKDEGQTISQFLSPVFLQLGPGAYWKKDENFRFNFSPAAMKFIFVHEKFTKHGKSFSVEQGETSRLEFGASAYGYYRFKVFENISIENILGLYSNYIVNTKNVDFDYQLNIYMNVTKYITTNFNYQALYDNESFGALQQKQTLGVGIKYTVN